MLGKIKEIKEGFGYEIRPVAKMNGSNGNQLGMMAMINVLGGWSNMVGYKVETDLHTFCVLIDNEQLCCENWGYMTSEDDLDYFVNTELLEVKVTDTALNQKVLTKMSDEYVNANEIQFVDFVTDKGTFQLAVYNSHNGYYGHSIVVAKDEDIILNDTL